MWRGERVDPIADYGDRIEFLTNVRLLFLAVKITNKKQMEIEMKLTRPKLGKKLTTKYLDVKKNNMERETLSHENQDQRYEW